MADDWERVDTGPPDRRRLRTAQTVAVEYEPLVSETTFDSPLNPQTLYVTMDAGIDAETGRFDITWTTDGYYRYHYSDGQEFNYRYDHHPRPDVPTRHVHEPPAANHDAVPSCIDVEPVPLVTLAVLQLWRETVETGDIDRLQQPNPP